MELYIQMGHGMQSMCRELTAYWGESTVIVGPRNIQPTSLEKFGKDIIQSGGNVLFDPQIYFPRKRHKTLSKYKYWPTDNITGVETGDCDSTIEELYAINQLMNTSAFILPSVTTDRIDHLWDKYQQMRIQGAQKLAQNMLLYQTVALSGGVMIDSNQVEAIIQYSSKWDVDGVYIVLEHPERLYLVDKPLWVTNLMALVAGIKRSGKKVIVGYASHQMLCLALSKCDAIATGNFLNVRWFQPELFETLENDEISRRAVWYYCPQSLSEYKVPFLDIAKRMDVLSAMKPSADMLSPYCEMLFGAGLPSSTGYSEKEAHRHYINCVWHQCKSAVRDTYEETRNAHLALLDTAEQVISGLRAKGIRGQDRDFSEIIDVNRAAIAAHDMDFNFTLSQEWSTL